MDEADFEKNVFINCPFDKEFEPILQAIMFCVVYLGLNPRFTLENSDSGSVRLEKIVELINSCKFSIHDISRCKATKKGEMYRLNMPFELGIDYGAKRYGGGILSSKIFLILEEQKYSSKSALSDIAGWDIRCHDARFEKAIKEVRDWLTQEAGVKPVGPSKIRGAYVTFQEWRLEKKLEEGFSKEDLYEYPTNEVLQEMKEWLELGEPT